MNLSNVGEEFIKAREQCRLAPYYDQAGLPTIGWGHLLSSTAWEPLSHFAAIDQAAADALFLADVAPAEHIVERVAATGSTTQAQFDALTSLAFNIGIVGFAGSTVARLVRTGAPIAEIRAGFLMWDKVRDPASGILVPSAGLLARRTAEADLYEGVA